ncbi:MAG: type II toxin-antitoxin system VapC family toxin [Lautropia sp.]|nr:type II toxin-antitoxin system VapC family toxin [Lautropia sp.]
MKISVDTNVLLRSVVRDDPGQASVADRALREASMISISLPCLCEFVWVLRKVYRFERAKIALAIRALMGADKIILNRPAVKVGLSLLDAGGDFADGVLAYEGARLGGEIFLSFDRQAVSLLQRQGMLVRMLSSSEN